MDPTIPNSGQFDDKKPINGNNIVEDKKNNVQNKLDKIRKNQDDLLNLVFDNNCENCVSKEASSAGAIFISFIISVIVALIAFYIMTSYFKNNLDNSMAAMIGGIIFLFTFLILFFLLKPKKPKDKECEI